jgi:hypothetical protein
MNKEQLENFFKSVSGRPDRVVGMIVRPKRDAQFIKDNDGVEAVIKQTCADIDHGASGCVMVDKDFKPTGEPAADPPGAYCKICKKRIWAHDDDTAFPIQVSFYGDWQGIGGGACCEECSKLDDKEIMKSLGSAEGGA